MNTVKSSERVPESENPVKVLAAYRFKLYKESSKRYGIC